jgi:hypothetical protein
MQCFIDKRKETTIIARLCLDGVLSLGEVDLLLLGLLGNERGLVRGEPSADGARLLGSEVERGVPGAVRTRGVVVASGGRTHFLPL